jgi:hypothetical protein
MDAQPTYLVLGSVDGSEEEIAFRGVEVIEPQAVRE